MKKYIYIRENTNRVFLALLFSYITQYYMLGSKNLTGLFYSFVKSLLYSWKQIFLVLPPEIGQISSLLIGWRCCHVPLINLYLLLLTKTTDVCAWYLDFFPQKKIQGTFIMDVANLTQCCRKGALWSDSHFHWVPLKWNAACSISVR